MLQENKSSLFLQNIIVPTSDTIRLQYFTSLLIHDDHPVMLVGPSGCGKASIFREVFNKYENEIQLQSTYFNFYTTTIVLKIRC